MYLNGKFLILIMLFGLGFLETAHAQVYFEETFFPVYVAKNDAENPGGGSTSQAVPTESGLGYDLRTTLGYIYSFGLVTGLSFNYYSVDTSRPQTTLEGLKTSTKKSEIGLTLGYLLGGWKFMATYLLDAQKTAVQNYLSSTNEVFKNTGGSGIQLAIGYGLNLGAGFEIGPTLIYRVVSYSKQSHDVLAGSPSVPAYSSTSLQTKALDRELKPMITVSYRY